MNPKKKAPAKKKIANPTTIKGWLETLPEPYQTQAISQAFPERLSFESKRLACSILCFSAWGRTNEGFEYWSAVEKWAAGFGELPEQSSRKPLEVGGIFIIPPPPISTTLRRVCGYLLATAPVTSMLIAAMVLGNYWIAGAIVVACLMIACIVTGIEMIFD